MKANTNRKRSIRGIVFACILTLLLASSTSARSFQSHRDRDRSPHLSHPRDRQVRLQHRHSKIRITEPSHSSHHRRFHRTRHSGRIRVRPHYGAVFLNLPAGCGRLIIGGSTYFTHGGAYYRRCPTGYVLVQAPLRTRVQAPPVFQRPDTAYGRLIVITERLNVRSGPGLNHRVLSRVFRGDRLTITGSATGWWHVRLPDGLQGWVMARYTTTR